MLSWESLYTDAKDKAVDSDATNLIYLKRHINEGQRILEATLGLHHVERTYTFTTTAGTYSYNLPVGLIRPVAVYTTVGTQQYPGEPVFSEDIWRNLVAGTQASSSRSDVLKRYFTRRNTIELYPTPSTSSLTVTLIYEGVRKDLSADDYDTGTITTLANGGTAVTASGSTFTSAMIGRYFQTDDKEWYEISAAPTATTLTLVSPYQGVAISAGTSSYTIGEFPLTPGPTHIIPVYYALWQYYIGPKKNPDLARMYKDMFEGNGNYTYTGLKWAKREFGHRYQQTVIPDQRQTLRNVNPNYYLSGGAVT